jgi:hypothetical protein
VNDTNNGYKVFGLRIAVKNDVRLNRGKPDPASKDGSRGTTGGKISQPVIKPVEALEVLERHTWPSLRGQPVENVN